MFKNVFKTPNISHDAAHFEVDGKLTNAELHEQIMDGVDDTALRQRSYDYLKSLGTPEDVLALFK